MQPHAHINGRYRAGADYEVPAVDFAASAMELAKIGFHVFPLKVNEKVPALSKAEGGQGFKDATIQPALIREQGQRFPHANVGIRTGAESGVIIIDVDPRNGGNETLKAMLAEAGCALPENTPTALTGNGGRHYFFAYEPGIGCSNNRLGPGIDVKSDGGYVVVSPSIIGPSKNGPGGPYKWTVSPFDVPPAPLPAWLRERLRPSEPSHRRKSKPLAERERNALAEIEAALSYVPADEREDWRRVGQSLFHAFGDTGRALWDRWSSRSAKYDAADQARVWASLAKSMVTDPASIFKLAQQHGADLAAISREHGSGGTPSRIWEPRRHGSDGEMHGERLDNHEPTPLVRPLPPAETFPLAALGPELEAMVRALAEIVQSPLAMCASTVLATVTLAAQAHVNVVLPVGDGLIRPVSGLFITIGRSGERKSATDDLAMRAVRIREEEKRTVYAIEHRAWQDAHEAWEVERKSILSKKGEKDAKRADLEALGAEPEAPLVPILVMAEPTIEGLAKLLMHGQASVGVFSAEGGQFVGGHAMSDDAKLRSAAALSQLWDGEPWKRIRSLDGASTIANRRVALHLMVQPDVAATLVNDPVLRDQGLLSRMLVTFPESTMGTRFYRRPSAEALQTINRLTARLGAALSSPQPLKDGTRNELQPGRLHLSAEARTMWIEFTDNIERMLGPGGVLEPISGFAAKMGEHAARLAAVMAWWADHNAREIDAAALDGAIALVEHYEEEALRLYQSSVVPLDIAEAQRLLDWLTATWQGPFVSVPDICRLGPNSTRVAKRAKELVAILAEHGWLDPVTGGAVIEGKKRREAWSIRGRK